MWLRIISAFCLLGLVFFASDVMATPAFVQGNACQSAASSNSITCAFNSNVTAGNLIAIAIYYDAANTGLLSSISADSCGNSYTIADQDIGDGFNDGAQAYKANASGGSACSITVNFANTSTGWRILMLHEVSGIATTTPLDCHSMSGSNNGTTVSQSCTAGTSGDYVMGSIASPEAIATFTYTKGGTYTLEEGGAPSTAYASEDKVSAVSGSITADWTVSGTNSDSVAGIMTFLASGGGGGGGGATGTLMLMGVGK